MRLAFGVWRLATAAREKGLDNSMQLQPNCKPLQESCESAHLRISGLGVPTEETEGKSTPKQRTRKRSLTDPGAPRAKWRAGNPPFLPNVHLCRFRCSIYTRTPRGDGSLPVGTARSGSDVPASWRSTSEYTSPRTPHFVARSVPSSSASGGKQPGTVRADPHRTGEKPYADNSRAIRQFPSPARPAYR